jgi:hypothetical protein
MLLLVAVGTSIHSVHQNGVNCGSLVKPIDLEQNGPVGTNPRPCEGAHDFEMVFVFGLVVAGFGTIVVRAGRRTRASMTPTESD